MGKVFYPVKINGKSFRALFDTGSDDNYINLKVSDKLMFKKNKKEFTYYGDGHKQKLYIQEYRLKIIKKGVRKMEITATFNLNPNQQEDVIIGHPIMQYFEISIDPSSRKLIFERSKIKRY